MKKVNDVPIVLLPVLEKFSDAGKIREATILVNTESIRALVEIDGMQLVVNNAQFLVRSSWAKNNTEHSWLVNCMIGDF